MEKKPKISIRKVLQALLTLVVTIGCIVAMASASKTENGKTLKGINIEIKNGNKYHFIDKADLMNLVVSDRHLDIMHMPLGKIDIHSMEQILRADQWVNDAQVYIDNMHVMHISVSQRVPVARIFEADGSSYYLDTALNALQLSTKYVYYATVVTNVPELKNDSISKDLKAQIVTLVKHIEKDTFWNAQVSEIMVDSAHSFELVPVLGTHKIILGDTSMLDEKFHNLFVFYKNVLNNIGWDKYEVLDVRYKDQVVASPSLPFKLPADKAMATMNWVKSIIGTDSTGGKSSASVDSERVKKALEAKMAEPPKTMVLQGTQAMLSRLQSGKTPAIVAPKKAPAKVPAPVAHNVVKLPAPVAHAAQKPAPATAKPAEHKHPIGPMPDKVVAPQAHAKLAAPPKPAAKPEPKSAHKAEPKPTPPAKKEAAKKPEKKEVKDKPAAPKKETPKKETVKKETTPKADPAPKAIYQGQ